MRSCNTNWKILFLGGAQAQIPIIEEAKKRGMYVITCDYLSNNPGHKLADEYYNVSTTDYEGIIKLAQRIKPDFVFAYASDPAAPVAAYVCEKLGIKSNSFESIKQLAEKDHFRKLLKNNGFNVPKYIVIDEYEEIKNEINGFTFPFIIKPVDSSGSKGVARVTSENNLDTLFKTALSFSRKKKVIIEEFIDNNFADIHGDGFVIDGKLVFSCLGDHVYNKTSNPYNPIGTLWPTKISDTDLNKITREVDKIIALSGFRNGAINIEARICSRGVHYIMEIGPRSGGHFVPQAIKYSTGFDMVAASIDLLLGRKIKIPVHVTKPAAYYALHADKPGILKEILISDKIKPFIKELHQYIQPGEKVQIFSSANAAIGIVLFLFNSRDEMYHYINNIGDYLNLKIKI